MLGDVNYEATIPSSVTLYYEAIRGKKRGILDERLVYIVIVCKGQGGCALLPPFLRTPGGKTDLNGTGEEGKFLIWNSRHLDRLGVRGGAQNRLKS